MNIKLIDDGTYEVYQDGQRIGYTTWCGSARHPQWGFVIVRPSGQLIGNSKYYDTSTLAKNAMLDKMYELEIAG